MTLNFQNKFIFPAPETSYSAADKMHEIIYVPRNVMDWAHQRRQAGFPKQEDLMLKLQN